MDGMEMGIESLIGLLWVKEGKGKGKGKREKKSAEQSR